MKKTIIYLVFAAFLITGYNLSIAVETNLNSQVTENNEEVSIVYEANNFVIVKKDNKFGVFDKINKKYFVKPVLDDISQLTNKNNYEFKIKSGDMLGYMNLLTKDTFVSNFTDVNILNNEYLKVKKDNKSGIVDKKGKVIVPVEYNTVDVTKYDDTEYLIGRTIGRYDAFYSDGTPVSKSDLKEADKSNYGLTLLNDLNPLLKKFRFIQKNKEQESDNISSSEPEIQKLPIPATDREKAGEIKLEVDENEIIGEITTNENEPEIDINTDPLPDNVKKISVKHEDFNSKLNTIAEANEAVDVVTINNKAYFVTNNNGRIGLKMKNGKDLIPARYTAIKIEDLDKKFNNQIIAAVDVRGNSTKLYDANGYVLAKRFHDKINVYTSMRKYEYYQDGDKYSVDFNGRKVGEIKILDDGSYIYTKTAFNLSNMKKANELFLTLLESEK